MGGDLVFLVDIDGPNKGKSQFGVDRYTFNVDPTDLVLRPNSLSMLGEVMNGDFGGHYDIYYWVIYNENMDYLKCPDKLNWDTQTSCK